MPAEASRLQRRIQRRDRWFFAVLACAAAIGTPAAVLLSRHGPAHESGPSARCIETDHAGVMGGGTYRYCGADVVQFCRQFGPSEEAIATKCDELGVRATPARASRRPPGTQPPS
jgi:hypothetical protein